MKWLKSHCLLHTIWEMESAFTQSNGNVMDKLWAYVHDNPQLLVVSKIIINQSAPWSSPGLAKSVMKNLHLSKLMMEEEWPGIYGDAKKYTEVVIDNYL